MYIKSGIVFAAGGIYFLASTFAAIANPLARDRDQAQHRDETRPPQQNFAQRIIAASRPMFGTPALIAEARKYLGTNPTDRKTLWCATFMNMILRNTGFAGTNSDAARSFAQYGRRISAPEVGAIAVLTRGERGGHVGVVSGIDPHGNPIIISGNHNKRVGIGVYPQSRVIAYVMPSDQRSVPAQIAAHSGASRAASEQSLESPIAELLAAIEAERDRAQAREPVRQTAHPAAPPVLAYRTVQQLPEQEAGNGGLPPTTPWGELLGAMNGARGSQLDRRVERATPGRTIR